jgi:hypothetical protein
MNHERAADHAAALDISPGRERKLPGRPKLGRARPRSPCADEMNELQKEMIMTKKIGIAAIAALLSLGAVNLAQADPRPGDDTNRYENKSTGG